jgi:hypothetical protein
MREGGREKKKERRKGERKGKEKGKGRKGEREGKERRKGREGKRREGKDQVAGLIDSFQHAQWNYVYEKIYHQYILTFGE